MAVLKLWASLDKDDKLWDLMTFDSRTGVLPKVSAVKLEGASKTQGGTKAKAKGKRQRSGKKPTIRTKKNKKEKPPT